MNAQDKQPNDPSPRARVQLNARIPAELDDDMREYAHEARISRQELIERMAREYLNRHWKKRG